MYNLYFSITVLFITLIKPTLVKSQLHDICDGNNGRRFYLEHGESGSLHANFQNNVWYAQNKNLSNNRCIVQYFTCSACVIEIKFSYLNISKTCGKSSVFDKCGRDYVWIYEPPTEDTSGEQFCGKFIQNNVSELNYISQTRTVAVAFIYNNEYGHAFSLDYSTRRNRIQISGRPVLGSSNNASQFIQSAFFPQPYPVDLSVEYVINCESTDLCRISLLFTDFLIADSSIIEFFDWNGLRISVVTGNTFRPPVIISTGPTLVVRFYANGVSSLGFKAVYSFSLGHLEDSTFNPNIGCGGYVNNLGGAITMMNMVEADAKFFDCIWIIKPIVNFLHRKTHLYVKVIHFLGFGTTELTIRQGLTSTKQLVELLRYPMTRYNPERQTEHIVHISKGFYIRLRGHFRPDTSLAIVFAAFNYKECFSGSDFLCHNLRCISGLLNCDGFDHCGDNSDESSRCTEDLKNHRQFSKIPNFLFPKMEQYSDIATSTLVFLTCSFGLIGIILAMSLLLYRVNSRARHHRQIQDHIETIHAILEEGVRDVEEEIIVPDKPPDYEPPPEYDEIAKLKFLASISSGGASKSKSELYSSKLPENSSEARASTSPSALFDIVDYAHSLPSTSVGSQTTPMAKIPDSPPPTYENIKKLLGKKTELVSHKSVTESHASKCDSPISGSSYVSLGSETPETGEVSNLESGEEKSMKHFENVQKLRSQFLSEIKRGIRHCRSSNLIKHARRMFSLSEQHLVRYFSESELVCMFDNESCWATNNSRLKKSYSTDI